MPASLSDKPAMPEPVKVSWLVQCKRACQKQPTFREETKSTHENTDPELAGYCHLIAGRIGRVGAGRRRRQVLVQQMPGLPCDRRKCQEQGRSGAERHRRPQV